MALKTRQSKGELPATGVIYEFADYRFEPGASRLHNGKDTLHLPPLEMALLELLVKNHGRLVKHRMIWDTLWPDQDVSYDSLARCVYSLRRGLGGTGGKMIKSVPRKGYTFTAATKTLKPALKVNSVIEKSIETLPKAYSLYQVGLLQAGLPSYENQQRAVDFFRRANKIDPNYCVPLGAIAEISMYQCARGYLSPEDAEKQAYEAYSRALATDPELVSALAAKAWFDASYHGNIPAAMRIFDHAQDLDPNHALTYLLRGWIERGAGQVQAALKTLSKGIEVDKLNLNIANSTALTLFFAGRAEEAIELEQSYLNDRPEIDVGHIYMAAFLSWQGKHPEAIRSAKRGLAISPSDPNAMCTLSYALARGGFTDKARKLAEQSRASTSPRPSPIFLAPAYLALGEEATSLSILQEARDIKCPWFTMAAIDPRLESIRDTAGFRALFDSK